MNETRTERKQRLQQEGKWDAFLALRDRLRAEGMSPAEADEEAMRQIDAAPSSSPEPSPPVPPLDASAEGDSDPPPPAPPAVIPLTAACTKCGRVRLLPDRERCEACYLEWQARQKPSQLQAMERFLNKEKDPKSRWDELIERTFKDRPDKFLDRYERLQVQHEERMKVLEGQGKQDDEGTERAMELLRQWLEESKEPEEETARRKEEEAR
jgi:hypothetical protein